MGKENKGGNQHGGQVIPMICVCETCNERPKRAGFCSEHFAWFKEGLITKEGSKAKDFDKKYQHFMRRSSQKAA